MLCDPFVSFPFPFENVLNGGVGTETAEVIKLEIYLVKVSLDLEQFWMN